MGSWAIHFALQPSSERDLNALMEKEGSTKI